MEDMGMGMMASLARFVAASLVLVLCSSAAIGGERAKITTWNLEWFPGRKPVAQSWDEIAHLSIVHEKLEEISPDILFLQEIRNETSVRNALKILPKMKLRAISKFPNFAGLSQQVALASTIEPILSGTERFRVQGKEDPPRGFVWGVFKLHGEFVVLYGLHLKSNRGGIEINIPKRENGILQLLEFHSILKQRFFEQGQTLTAVVTGDLNTDPGQPRFTAEKTVSHLLQAGFVSGFEGLGRTKVITWPSNGSYPDACFDHIFFQENKIFSYSKAWIEKKTEEASDHRAVSILIEQKSQPTSE